MRIISRFQEIRQTRHENLVKDIKRLSSHIASECPPDHTTPDGTYGVLIGSIYIRNGDEKDSVVITLDGNVHLQSNGKEYSLWNLSTTKLHILQQLKSLLIEYLSPSRDQH